MTEKEIARNTKHALDAYDIMIKTRTASRKASEQAEAGLRAMRESPAGWLQDNLYDLAMPQKGIPASDFEG